MGIHVRPLRGSPTHNAFQHKMAPCQTAIRDAAAEPGRYPLIMYSHPSGAHRRAATFLCTHLSSHGYVVAALDHSEVSAPELRDPQGETAEQKAARMQAVIASRVPDVALPARSCFE